MVLSDDEITAIRRWARELVKTWRPLTPDQLELVKRIMGGARKGGAPADDDGGSNDHLRAAKRESGSRRAA